MSKLIKNLDVQLLAKLASKIEAEYAGDELSWRNSTFAWIWACPSRQRGQIGEQLVAGWCAAHGLKVEPPPDRDCDRVISGLRAEIKFSTWWAQGGYTFQQFRDQNYDIAICLGLSPFDAHACVTPKYDLKKHVIGHTPQHTGARGKDTFWIQGLDPKKPPQWIVPWGGTLERALSVLKTLAGVHS